MPCNCGSSRGGSTARVVYVARFSNGETKTYSSEIEARVAVTKRGGSYEPSVKK